jgi:hypothetical protein
LSILHENDLDDVIGLWIQFFPLTNGQTRLTSIFGREARLTYFAKLEAPNQWSP